jgi:hypothetical protein
MCLILRCPPLFGRASKDGRKRGVSACAPQRAKRLIYNLNSAFAFVRPIFSRSSSLIVAESNQIAA